MNIQATRKKRSRLLIPTLLLIALVIVIGAVVAYRYITASAPFSKYNITVDDGAMEADLQRLSADTYDSVLLSMHSTAPFSEDDFAFFRGLDTAVTAHTLLNTEELDRYLAYIFTTENTIGNIYLCLDPELLWVCADKKAETWILNMSEHLYTHIEAHPEVSFEILLPYPHLNYWTGLDEEDFETLLTVYHTLVGELSAYTNTKVFFPGYEHWLLFNPDHYTDTVFDTNDIITQKIFLYTFCDGVYQITPDNESLLLGALQETVVSEKTSPTRFPDLSDWDIVFFGDSVLANYEGSFSIPGYMTGLSHATTHNYAVGGSGATHVEGGVTSFPTTLDRFLNEGPSLEKENLCFVINYGFNDYFTGASVENADSPRDIGTYKGSLSSCIEKLQASFPKAQFIVVTPTHCSLFDNGTELLSEQGAPLADYVQAAREVAEELGTHFIDNYYSGPVTLTNLDLYLEDGVHPNEHGRLTLAKILMQFIDSEL